MNNFLSAAIIFFVLSCTSTKAPEAILPVPTGNQMRWQEMEYYAFVHFSLNTYTDEAWGFGNEDINLFNPEKLDCRQWARICKEAGMKGIIVTAKHHSGFCLWPSAYTEYSVKNAPWKDGKGDLVRELAEACAEYGLKLGIYVSPWDRNHPDYGRPEYITYFRNQIKELLTNYGPIFEIWFDGANGGTGYYGGANENRQIDRTTYYDWQPTYRMIRELQPEIVIWNDGGDRADLRWVGTEAGFVGETNWSLLNAKGEVAWGMLHFGLENGDSWVPAEVNTSIRPEWFYHPSEDDKVKTVPQLMETYYHSIGRNGTLLLNFPIMPNGLIHENDERAVLGMAKAIRQSFAENLATGKVAKATNTRGNDDTFGSEMAIDAAQETYWATDDTVTTASLTIDFGKSILFNRLMAQECIRLGQRVKSFTVEALVNGSWSEIAQGTTIGYKRILRFPGVEASAVRLNITDSKGSLVISNVGVYNAPVFLNSPTITRNQTGDISITTNDIGPLFYYTLDGIEPTTNAARFTQSVSTKGKVEVRAIAYDPTTGKSSAVAVEQFDIDRSNWKVLGSDDRNTSAVLDGNVATTWHQGKDTPLPVDLVIDLGSEQKVSGFRYHPDQGMWGPGIVTHYEFYVSGDNEKWKQVDQGEFSNIKNNPLWQVRRFSPASARYVKFRALQTTDGNGNTGYAELDMITE